MLFKIWQILSIGADAPSVGPVTWQERSLEVSRVRAEPSGGRQFVD